MSRIALMTDDALAHHQPVAHGDGDGVIARRNR
jgi:hypothetical protein